jgi:hypothetical protein
MCEPELRHSKRGRDDGKSKFGGGGKTPFALSLPLPPHATAVWPQRVYL